MLSEREVSAAIGTTAYGTNGDKLGTVEHFFVDDRTGAPTWVAVSTGLFGTRHSIVPAADAAFDEGTLRLPVTADAVKSAPDLSGDHLEPADEAELRRHYGLADRTAGTAPAEPTTQELRTPPPPVPTEAPERPVAPDDGSMVRSEERLRVGTERVATTRARLVKYVVTEDVQITVPIRREEIRVEEVPIDAPEPAPGESLQDDDDAGRGGGTTGGLPDEIVLHTERPVVTVEVVPTERVRLRTELVEGQETVTGQVQRERVVVDETPAPGVTPR
jgi:stress response protein YsnF